MNDVAAQDAELFTRVAETEPGIVRTLGVLIAELAEAELEPDLLRQLGGRVRRVGETLIMRADRLSPQPTIIDAPWGAI